MLDSLEVLLAKNDLVYDNSGAAIVFPSIDYYYFTDNVARRVKAAELQNDIPRNILRTGTTAMLVDYRYPELPPELRNFLDRHFQPYSKLLRLWGQRYAVSEPGPFEFLAVRDATYFFSPATAAGAVTVDGEAVSSATVFLKKGVHHIALKKEKAFPGDSFALLWLPANGIPYTPMSGFLNAKK
jgi:hypothetical protein